MTASTDPQIPGQEAIDVPTVEPAPVAPDPTPEEVPATPDPTLQPVPDAAQEASAGIAGDATSADTGSAPSDNPHRFRIIHELHGGPGADIIRVGEELATDAATAIKFLEQFVTKS